ncbi:MAG: GH25 family lysozyme [Saprospiraceae bacterium]|nr:GH25 family lysozyme [Saprospiraceae bacterium]
MATGCEADTERLSGYAVHGIDISRHQSKVNWDAVAAEGISFAFVKATEGRRHSDTFYCRNWAEMQRVGIKRGAYHFFRPSIDAKEQANNFIANVDMQYGDLPPVLDIEVDEDVPREVLAKQLKTWLYLVELRYSIRPIIYTSYKFYNKFIAGEFDKYPIWIAKYGGEAPRLGGQARWWFWQYGNKGRIKGIDGFVDFNVFYDSREELDKICLSGAMLSGIDRQYLLGKQSKF